MGKFDSNSAILVTLGCISGLLIHKKLKPLSTILILVTIIIGFSITNNLLVSICISMILGNIFVSLNEKYRIILPGDQSYAEDNIETELEAFCGFKNNCKKNNSIEYNNIKRSIIPMKKKIEGFTSKRENFTDVQDDIVESDKDDNSQSSDNSDNENEDVDDKEDEYFIDSKGSFLENYKGLSDKQVKGLNKDTQNLIKTQKQLIETLKNMGPALKDGKEILDTFKNYFGSDKDIGKMLSSFKVD